MSLRSYTKKWDRRMRRLISQTSDIIAQTPWEHMDTEYSPEVDLVVSADGETLEEFNPNLKAIADAAEEATRGPSEGMVTRSVFRRLNNQLARFEPHVVAQIFTSVHPCLRSIASLRTVSKAFLQCSYFVSMALLFLSPATPALCHRTLTETCCLPCTGVPPRPS